MSRTGGHVRRDPRKEKRKKRTRIVLIVIAVLLLALLVGGYAVFHRLYGIMGTGATGSSKNTPAPTSTPVADVTPSPSPTPRPTPTPEPTPEPLTEEELQKLEELNLLNNLQEEAEEILYSEDVYNLLLIGCDARGKQIERSDAMILVSINKATKEIWLTSFMRDTQVSIYRSDKTMWGTGHLNWATFVGGGDIGWLTATLENQRNFAVHIDNWAMVNFLDFVKVADLLGPIHATINEAQADDINWHMDEVYEMWDEENPDLAPHSRDYFPLEGGSFELTDGFQILGFARERHISGDGGRTQRQREILIEMWENVKKMSLKDQYTVLETVMSIIQTDLSEGKCFSLLLQAPSFMNYTIHTMRMPARGAYWDGRDEDGLFATFTDFWVCRNIIRATIYGEDVAKGNLVSTWTGNRIQVYDPETGKFYGE